MVTEKQILEVFVQILRGINYLSQNGLSHGRLKPSKMILDENGVVQILGNDLLFFGNRKIYHNFMAPEQILQVQKGQEYQSSIQSDIFQLGILLYIFLYQSHPFQSNNIQEYEQKILKSGKLDIPAEPKYSKDLIKLLKKMIVNEPEKRIKLSEIIKNSLFCVPKSPFTEKDQRLDFIISN